MYQLKIDLKELNKPVLVDFEIEYHPYEKQTLTHSGREEEFNIQNLTWNKGDFNALDNEVVADNMGYIEKKIMKWCEDRKCPDEPDEY